MHPCLVLPLLFLKVVKAASIHKFDARSDLCDSLVPDCADLPTTFGTSKLDLSSPSGLDLPAAPKLALSLNTEKPELQPPYGNGAPGSVGEKNPSIDQNTQFFQAFNAPMNMWQTPADEVIAPTSEKTGKISSSEEPDFSPLTGGWRGSCHIYGIGCKMCLARPVAAPFLPFQDFCKAAVLRPLQSDPEKYDLCLEEQDMSPVCIAHDPAHDDTPVLQARSDWGVGWWGYCNEQGLLCAICWKWETNESNGCTPAVPTKFSLLAHFQQNPSTWDTWLCFEGEKPSVRTCVNNDRWFKGSFDAN
ncbi:hypothetical protein MMC22_005179 [Lobaria immixta]|nr:hypothetical protein [Lobaria immixta]